jgi:large subunit ribosomal protein L24
VAAKQAVIDQKIHVKREDRVVVLAGKEKGKKGKVLRTVPEKGAVIVEGLNLIKRHTKPTQKNPQGGVIMREAPIRASNVQLVCPQCSEPSRVRRERADGKLVRYCKKCDQPIDK